MMNLETAFREYMDELRERLADIGHNVGVMRDDGDTTASISGSNYSKCTLRSVYLALVMSLFPMLLLKPVRPKLCKYNL